VETYVVGSSLPTFFFDSLGLAIFQSDSQSDSLFPHVYAAGRGNFEALRFDWAGEWLISCLDEQLVGCKVVQAGSQ